MSAGREKRRSEGPQGDRATTTRRRTGLPPVLTAEIHGLLLKLIRAKSMGEEGSEVAKEGQNAPQIRQAVESYARERSPFLWVEAEDPNAPVQWVDGIRGPAKTTLLFLKAIDLSLEVKRHLEIATVGNLRSCLETILTKLLKNGDTGVELREEALVSSAEHALLEAVGDSPECPQADLKEKVRLLWSEAVKSLWHFSHAGKRFVSTRYRGQLDRVFCKYLQRPPASFFRIPEFEVRGTADQIAVASEVLRHLRSNGWSVLSGCGGAGKSFVLGQIAKVLRNWMVPNEHLRAVMCPVCEAAILPGKCQCGFVKPSGSMRSIKIVFAAPTNRAVSVLQRIMDDESHVCCTLHAMSCMRHEAPIDLLVVDESSMLSSDHGDIISRSGAAKRAAVLLVGDDLQLLPVGSGEVFRPLLKRAGLPCLTENLRAHGALRRPIASIREGCASEASAFGVTASKDSERHERIYQDIASSGGSAQVMSLRNEDRINFCCFSARKHHSCEEDDYSCGKGNPFYFKPFVGEPVRFQKNTYKPHACRGSIGVISEVKEEMIQESGKAPRKVYSLEVRMTPDGPSVSVQCSAGSLSYELRPAFAITVHDSQGGEFDHVHILMPPTEKSPLCTLEMLYTAASRARETLKIWCLNRDFAVFEEAMGRVSPLRATPFKSLLKSSSDSV
jgi:AAA domain/UvrD-like helicase C-terminal domain